MLVCGQNKGRFVHLQNAAQYGGCADLLKCAEPDGTGL
jgi:hypothetical protein